MRFVLLIMCILCTAGVLFANAESSNNTGQLLSLYMENAEKTASKIMELSDKLPLFIEVAHGQKDIILTLLEIRKVNLSKNKIVESIFSYNAIAKLVQSQFFINFNYRTEEDEDAIIFQGKFFLSSYIHMYWLNKMGLDDEASIKLLFSYFINSKTKSFLIQKGVLDNISTLYLEGSSPNLAVIDKAQESQKKYQRELTSSQFIDSKLQEKESKLFMNISMYSNEGVLKNYQEVFTKIEPYFYIFTTHELDSVFREIMALTLGEVYKDIMIENTIFEALYNRTSVLIDPNNISYGFKEIDQYMISVYFENENTAMPHLLQYYKDVHIQLIEVPEDQYENLTQRIAKDVNQSEKQVQTKIIKSSLGMNHIELLIESNCLKNEGVDEIQVIFKDKKYLLSLIIDIEKNLKDGFSYLDALKAAFLSLTPRVAQDQFYRIVQNLVGKRMLLSIFNSILDTFIKILPKGVYNTIASAFFQKDVGGAAAQTAFRKILRTQIVSSSFVGGLFFVWDAFKWMKEDISNDEFIQRTAAGATATTLGALGGSFGMAFGPVGSFFGAAAGGIAGYYLGDYGSSYIPKSDIGILTEAISNEINFYSKISSQQEIKTLFMMFKTYLKATYDSFAKDRKSEESKQKILNFYRKYVQKTLLGEIQRRKPPCINFEPDRQV